MCRIVREKDSSGGGGGGGGGGEQKIVGGEKISTISASSTWRTGD